MYLFYLFFFEEDSLFLIIMIYFIDFDREESGPGMTASGPRSVSVFLGSVSQF